MFYLSLRSRVIFLRGSASSLLRYIATIATTTRKLFPDNSISKSLFILYFGHRACGQPNQTKTTTSEVTNFVIWINVRIGSCLFVWTAFFLMSSGFNVKICINAFLSISLFFFSLPTSVSHPILQSPDQKQMQKNTHLPYTQQRHKTGRKTKQIKENFRSFHIALSSSRRSSEIK